MRRPGNESVRAGSLHPLERANLNASKRPSVPLNDWTPLAARFSRVYVSTASLGNPVRPTTKPID